VSCPSDAQSASWLYSGATQTVSSGRRRFGGTKSALLADCLRAPTEFALTHAAARRSLVSDPTASTARFVVATTGRQHGTSVADVACLSRLCACLVDGVSDDKAEPRTHRTAGSWTRLRRTRVARSLAMRNLALDVADNCVRSHCHRSHPQDSSRIQDVSRHKVS
jgi:hypothetical protein